MRNPFKGFRLTLHPSASNTLNNVLAFMPQDRLPGVRTKCMADMKKAIRKRYWELKKDKVAITTDNLIQFIYDFDKGNYAKVCEKKMLITRDDWTYLANEVLAEINK